MKTKILAITLFVIGALIACKKVEQNVSNTAKFTDTELNIDKNSAFVAEERKIKEGIMGFSALSKSDRKAIIDGIIMDNKHVAHIVNNTMPIFKKLSKAEVIELYKIIIPNSNFKIIEKDRIIVDYHTSFAPCEYWITYWSKRYSTYVIDQCEAPGKNQCFRYVPCN